MAGQRTITRSILNIFLGTLHIVLILSSSPVQSRRVTFALNNPTYNVLEGDTIQLVCEQETSIINIEWKEIKARVISKSNRTQFTPDNFSFSHNTSTGILTITNITRFFHNKYTCERDTADLNEQSLTLNVIYKPPTTLPACASNYSFDNIIFSTNDVFHFTCTTEEANPRVQMSMFIYDKNDTRKNISRYAQLSNETLSYQFNQSSISNQSRFVCEVSQEFPPPYEDQTYIKHCSLYGSAPSFSLAIEPFNSTVEHGKSVTLTCASNISGTSLELTGVQDHCVGNNTMLGTNVTMICSGLLEGTKFDVNCTGSYKDITSFNSTSISVRALTFGTEPSGTKWYFAAGAICLISLIAGMIWICKINGVPAFRSERKAPSTRNNPTTTEQHNVSENSSNNNPNHAEGTNQSEQRMDECYDSSPIEMEENPIYEPYTEKGPTPPGYHSNHVLQPLTQMRPQ